MFRDALADLPVVLPDYALGRPASDRTAWECLPPRVSAVLVARGEQALATPWPLLTAGDYLDFLRNGNRTRFEERYFDRRRRLAALVLAECAEDEGRFLDAVVDGIFLVCEESGWQLPAHNAYDRGGPRLPLPDADRPVIDLFAAETGALLAVAAFLLGERLDGVDPAVSRRIDREIARRILDPYVGGHFWWMGSGDEPMNNWTAWCSQNVLLTAFARPNGQDLRRRVVERVAASLDAFCKDYGEDGACPEGALYWRHAGLCLFGALRILAGVAPAAFAPLWGAPKLRAIAEFIVDMNVQGPHYFNFGDASARLDRCGAREFLFGRAVGSQRLARFAAEDAARDESFERPCEINLWYRLTDAEMQVELAAALAAGGEPPAGRDIHYPSIGLTVARDERFALAVKGGNNGDSHNHNDVGSITLWRDGSPVLIDLGVESYTARTFSAHRYEIWTMQSAWHNLPSFGGVGQSDGPTFGARDHHVALGTNEAFVSMEIAGAYPAQAELVSYRREVRLMKNSHVEIVDRWQGGRTPTLSLVFALEPVFEAGALVLGNGARIAIEGGGAMCRETVAIEDARLRQAWNSPIWRVLVPLSGDRLRLVIT